MQYFTCKTDSAEYDDGFLSVSNSHTLQTPEKFAFEARI